MVRTDENGEAIARIRMAVNLHDAELGKKKQLENMTDGSGPLSTPCLSDEHWSLGSPLQVVSAVQLEKENQDNPAFRHFERNLVHFLKEDVVKEFDWSGPFQVSSKH